MVNTFRQDQATSRARTADAGSDADSRSAISRLHHRMDPRSTRPPMSRKAGRSKTRDNGLQRCLRPSDSRGQLVSPLADQTGRDLLQ